MNKNIILVTGGAGFIGSKLIEYLIKIKIKEEIISLDNYSSGYKGNHIKNSKVKYIKGDNKNINNGKKLYITSSHKIEITSKNSQGQAISFRTNINVELKIENEENNESKNRNFNKELAYNNKENKFLLVEYQNSIKKELVNQIIGEIIIYLNTQ